MQEQFKHILIMRDMTFEYYIQKLAEGKTNGLELSLLTLCQMFRISIILLCENFLWKSEERLLDDFHMYFIMFKGGRIMSASCRDGQRFLLQLLTVLQPFLQAILSTDGFTTDAPSFQIPPKRKCGCPRKLTKHENVDSSDVSDLFQCL